MSDVPAEVLAELQEGGARLGAALATVPDARWGDRPGAEAWSVAEIVEHLILVEHGIGSILAKRMGAEGPADPDPDPAATEARIRAVMPNRTDFRVKSPEPFMPSGRWPTPAALREEMARARATTVALAQGATAFRQRRFPHPRFGPLDGVQWLVFATVHADRHLAQLREVLAATRGGA